MKKIILYSLFLFVSAICWSQQPVALITDSVKTLPQLFQKGFIWKIGNETALNSSIHISSNKELWFYFFCLLALYLGLFKFFYQKYLSTLFKVFFNSSLKQSQLTDQLQQAKLPSLLLNIFFACTLGLFIFLLLNNFAQHQKTSWYYLAATILLAAIVYISKTVILHFTGIISGLKEQTNTYIFIIFLINKVMGILLLPLTMLMIFGSGAVSESFKWVGIFIVLLLFILRYYRSYGLLQNKLKVNPLHFALFITGVEIVPMLVIYKAAMIFLGKNL